MLFDCYISQIKKLNRIWVNGMLKITLVIDNRLTTRTHNYSILFFVTKYFMNTSNFNKVCRIISTLEVQTIVNKAVFFKVQSNKVEKCSLSIKVCLSFGLFTCSSLCVPLIVTNFYSHVFIQCAFSFVQWLSFILYP